jgi:hypothetical protein
MPDSAKEALEGMLAEGVTPKEIVSKLEGAGYSIQPPPSDESYGEGEEAPAAVLAIGVGGPPEEAGEDEGNAESESEKEEEAPYESQKDKRMDAAQKAMKQHGF